MLLSILLLVIYSVYITPTKGDCLEGQCTLVTGECVSGAGPGRLCAECDYKGYYVLGECFCTNRLADVNNQCNLPSAVNRTRTLTRVVYEGVCTPFTTWTEGFWANTPAGTLGWIGPTAVNDYIYGTKLPPTSAVCYNTFYVPQPETISASAFLANVTACSQLGGPDPDQMYRPEYEYMSGRPLRVLDTQNTPSVTCAGHGTWDQDLHGCVCSTGWTLALAGLGYADTPVYLCQECLGPLGPPVPVQNSFLDTGQESLQFSFCSVPWTPDPLDGQLKACSGHGDYLTNGCQCDSDPVNGYWRLAPYSLDQRTLYLSGPEQYTEIIETYTVDTCLGCQTGFSVNEGCTVNRTESPTSFPTDHPTENPTGNPTKNPTKNPTLNPTRDPTKNPIKKPTVNPSRNPTVNPTRNPSRNPSRNPTHNPTLIPTVNPTTNPTVNPTRNPSRNPTKIPTKNPTKNPTLGPTVNPSRGPTLNPSRNPTVNPTVNPSRNPTVNPTVSPTVNPTVNPTTNPTKHPTRNPTRDPTVNPSHNPTVNPTHLPTVNPTVNPTRNPTQNPIKAPTLHPTLNPSVNPTRNPTVKPTTDPTLNPTINPTVKPTTDPTKNPSFNPTKNPSRNPTTNPTKNPTRNPTKDPTKNPTRNPTKKPTKDPTKNPTKNPTKKPTKDPTRNPTKNPTIAMCPNCEVTAACECLNC